MGIKFEEKRRIFHLFTKNYSYYIHINKLNYLIHLYDGKYLTDISKERVSERYMERYSYLEIDDDNKELVWNKNYRQIMDEDYYFSLLASNFEAASFGKTDKRGAFSIVIGNDNLPITNFLFDSYKIIEGNTLKDETYPHIKLSKKEGKTLIITLKEEYKDVYLELYYEVIPRLDTIVRYSKLINKSKESFIVKKLSSLELDLNSSDYKILALKGTWGNDREIEYIPLNHSITKISDNHVSRGFNFNPSIALIKNDTTDDYGECYAFSPLWSGDFSYEINVDETDQTRILLGYNEENFEYLLKENEELLSFESIMTYSSNGINDLTHKLHDLIREKILNKVSIKSIYKDYILVNSWEAFGADINTEKIIKFIAKAKELNINLVVIDDGWFKGRNDDKSSLGDFVEDKKKIDLEIISNYAKKMNIDLGIRIEPEMISPNSDLFKEHKNFALIPKDYPHPTLSRNQLVLDLVNDEVIDYAFNMIKNLMDKFNFSYVKWDFNRFLSEAYSPSLEKERLNETSYRFTLGVYKLLYKFKKAYPNVFLETCASGGGRYDLGMMYYSNQIWASDETDISLRSLIQYSTNLFYPLLVCGSHVSNRALGSLLDKACLAIFGTFGYELDITSLKEKEENDIKFINDLYYKYHKEVIKKGDYYSIFNPFLNKNNYIAWNVVSKNKELVLVYFMLPRKEPTKTRFLKLKGLDKDKYYFNSLTNDVYKGDFYMNVGLNLSAPLEAYQSMVFVLVSLPLYKAKLYRRYKQVDGGKRDKLL